MKKHFRNIISITLLFVFTGIAVACVLIKTKINHHQVVEFTQHSSQVNALFFILTDEDENNETYDLPSVLLPNLILNKAVIMEARPQFVFHNISNFNVFKQKLPIFIQLRKLRL
jgi:hypothetical protein